MVKVAQRATESEVRPQKRRSGPAGSMSKQTKHESAKDDSKSIKAITRNAGSSSSLSTDRDLSSHPADGRLSVGTTRSSATKGSAMPASAKGSNASSRVSTDIHDGMAKVESEAVKPPELRISAGKDNDESEASEIPPDPLIRPYLMTPLTASKSTEKQQKRTTSTEELDRLSKRRKGDSEAKDGESEVRLSDRGSIDARLPHSDMEQIGNEDQSLSRVTENLLDRYERATTGRDWIELTSHLAKII